MRRAVLLAVFCGLSWFSAALGQTTRPATRPDLSPAQQRLIEYRQLQRELAGLLDKKDYAAGAEVCRKIIALAPRDGEARYNLACCLARLGKTEDALAELARAIDNGFVDADHIRADEDLAGLRDNPRFKEMIDKLVAGEKDRRDRLYEKGEPIDGLRIVEGDPTAGLRWRLRISPDATKARPHRLVVWLHPSGGSMNKTVEAMAPELAKRGFALLVPTAKDWSGWTGADGDRLIRHTLGDVAAKVEGVQVDRPILFGYSAGGQLALILWRQAPQNCGGVVIDAAYPVLPDPSGSGRFGVMSPPKAEGVKDCPLFVLLGDRDGNVRVWMAAEQSYRDAGVPLTIHYVTGQGHAWLFGSAQRDKLYTWLADVAAGRRPGEATTRPDSATTRPSGPRKPIRIEDVY